MMKTNYRSFSAILCLLIATPAYAAEFSYTYTELTVILSETKVQEETTQGYQRYFARRLSGSMAINTHLNLIAHYQTSQADVDIKSRLFRIGVGIHTPTSETADVFANLTLRHQTTEAPYSEKKAGYTLVLGNRHAFSKKLELDAALKYTRVPGKAETQLAIGIKQRLTETTSLGANYFSSADSTGISFFLRFDL